MILKFEARGGKSKGLKIFNNWCHGQQLKVVYVSANKTTHHEKNDGQQRLESEKEKLSKNCTKLAHPKPANYFLGSCCYSRH